MSLRTPRCSHTAAPKKTSYGKSVARSVEPTKRDREHFFRLWVVSVLVRTGHGTVALRLSQDSAAVEQQPRFLCLFSVPALVQSERRSAQAFYAPQDKRELGIGGVWAQQL